MVVVVDMVDMVGMEEVVRWAMLVRAMEVVVVMEAAMVGVGVGMVVVVVGMVVVVVAMVLLLAVMVVGALEEDMEVELVTAVVAEHIVGDIVVEEVMGVVDMVEEDMEEQV